MEYELAKKTNQDRKKYAELKEKNVNDFIDSIVGKQKKNAQYWFGNMAAEVLLLNIGVGLNLTDINS